MPTTQPRLGSGFEQLEAREVPSAVPYGDLRADYRNLYNDALVRADADMNTPGVILNNVSVAPGLIGDAYQFDDSADSIYVGNNVAINFTNERAFSVSAIASVEVPASPSANSAFTIFEKGTFETGGRSVGMAIRPGIAGGPVMDIWLQSDTATRIYVRIPLTGTDITAENTYTLVYDGSGSADGVQLYINGNAAEEPDSIEDSLGEDGPTPVDLIPTGQTYTGPSSVTPVESSAFTPFVGSMTVEAEINPSSLHYGAIATKYNSQSGDRAFHFALESNGKLTMYVYGQGPNDRGVTTQSPVVTANTWQTVSGSFDVATQSLQIRVNGQLVPSVIIGSTTLQNLPNGSASIRIGSDVGGSGNAGSHFSGQIRNARLSALAAPAAEIGNDDALTLHAGGTADQANELNGTLEVAMFGTALTSSQVSLLADRPVSAPLTLEQAQANVVAAQGALTAARAEYMNGLTPRIEVVSISGAQITLSVQLPPTAAANMQMDHHVGEKWIQAPNGTLDSRVTLALDISNEWRRTHYGEYTVSVSINEVRRDQFGVYWDPSTQQLGILSSAGNRAYEADTPPAAVTEAQEDLLNAEEVFFELGGERVVTLSSSIVDSDIPELNEQDTRIAVGRTVLDLTGAQHIVTTLEAEIHDIPGSILHWEGQKAITGNDPAFSHVRERIQSHINTLGIRQVVAPEQLAEAQTDLDALEERMDALIARLSEFIDADEAADFRHWVTERCAEARAALPPATFAEWCDRFEDGAYITAPLIYRTYDLAEPVVIRGFEENALVISGLSRPIDAHVRACVLQSHPTLFGASFAEDVQIALAMAGGYGNTFDGIRSSQSQILHQTTQGILWMNEHIGPVVSFVFNEKLRQKLGLTSNASVADPMAQVFWSQPFAAVHMQGVSGDCLPTNDEIRAAVEANFDAMYAAYAHMNGQQTAMYQAAYNRGMYGQDRTAEVSQFLQSVQGVLGSTGTGTLEERFARYAAAFPDLAAIAQQQIAGGQLIVDARTEAYMLALNPETMVVSEELVSEVLSENYTEPPERPDASLMTQQVKVIVAQRDVSAALQILNALYTPNSSIVVQGVALRTDSAAGRILAAVYQNSFNRDEYQLQQLFAQAQVVLGVRAADLWRAIQHNDYPTFFNALRYQAELHGYDRVFSNDPHTSSATVTDVEQVSTPLDGGSVHLRWNVVNNRAVSHARVYLIDPNANATPVGGNIALTGDIHSFNATIRAEDFASRLGIFGQQSFARDAQVQIVVWFADGSHEASDPIAVHVEGEASSAIKVDPEQIISGEVWAGLTVAEQNKLRDALDFGSDMPEKNQKVIQWLLNNYLLNGEMSFDEDGRFGMQWGGGVLSEWGQCKEWIDQIVVREAIPGTDLPPNTTGDDAYSWNLSNSTAVVAKADWEDGELGSVLIEPEYGISAGDMIQMANTDIDAFQHTVIVGSIQNDGIWVFDSNAIAANKPAYHFYSYESLNLTYDRFTIYRLS